MVNEDDLKDHMSVVDISYINKESSVLSQDNIKKIEKLKSAVFVCDADISQGMDVSFAGAYFYGDEEHPVSGSKYFKLFYDFNGNIMIADGSEIEDIDFTGVISDEGEVIYSRYRHDYRQSKDKSVWIDGGQSYLRSGLYPEHRFVTMRVREGVLRVD